MTPRPQILIVDDEKHTREGLKWALERQCPQWEIGVAETAEAALSRLAARSTDVVVTDLKLPGMDGLALLEKVKSEDPDIAVILITAWGTVETAVEAMKKGASDFLTKPVRNDELLIRIEQALGRQGLARENERLHRAVDERYGFKNIIGRSPAMDRVFEVARQVAPTRATVLIQGESGTGKELIARAIHQNSPRGARPFVAINCGALAPGLLESELFGHEKGAFTHAIRSKVGRFEMAHQGTIFLDEISETTPDFQVRLLRVLQEQAFERVGGTETIQVDVRVLAATNRDLLARVKEGKFREDLFYRLNVVTIELPPLRDRPEDIPLLVEAFLREFAGQYGKADLKVSPRTMAQLQGFDWPGNVRQLRNVIEGLVVMSNGREIPPRALPEPIRRGGPSRETLALRVGSTLAEVESEVIRATLLHFNGNRARTARQLGIGRKTLYRKMDAYGIQ